MKSTIEQLEEFQSSQEKLFLVQKETADLIASELRAQDEAGKRPQIVLDSFIQRLVDNHRITPREALFVINRILDSSDGSLVNDGTVIKYRFQLLRCVCGARYSEVLRTCPACKAPHNR